jgi:hypothetical protein
MREFDLSHAVSTFATHSGRQSSLWGLYVAATFAAVGFGAKEQLSVRAATLLTLGFLAFTLAHLRATMTVLKTLAAIRGEVLGRLESAPVETTDYPVTIRAAMRPALSPSASLAVHLAIDACVVAVIWAGVFMRI